MFRSIAIIRVVELAMLVHTVHLGELGLVRGDINQIRASHTFTRYCDCENIIRRTRAMDWL